MDDRRDSDESSTDEEVYQSKKEKVVSKQKKLEFESEETKLHFIKALENILSIEDEKPIMSKNQTLIKENKKLKTELENHIKKKKETHQILNKDLQRPDLESESIEKEKNLKIIALDGVIALFTEIRRAKSQQRLKEEKETGYEVLEKNLINTNKKSKFETVED